MKRLYIRLSALLLCLLLTGCALPVKESSSASEKPSSSAAAGSDPAPSSSASSSVSPETTAEVPSVSADDPGPVSHYVLCGQPVKTLYLAGESFDPTGLYVRDETDGSIYLSDELILPDEVLTADNKEVRLGFRETAFSCPLTVLPGDGAAGFTSRVSEKEYRDALEDLIIDCEPERLQNRDDEAFLISRALVNPFPDGHVASLKELVEYVEYHVFYGIRSVTVWLDFPYANAEEVLNELYWNSSLLPGTASLQLHDPGSGPLQILFRYYRDELLNATQNRTLGEYLTPCRLRSSRTGFSSPRVKEDGLTVFTSDQTVWALIHGYDIAPAAGSPAEALIRRAYEILTVYGDESWSDAERLYHIFLFFADHVIYDNPGDDAAAYVPDPELESDMLLSQLVSFRADGPLLYGNSACYGFAKASALLLELEGFDTVRVIAPEGECEGRSVFKKTLLGGFEEAISSHSYLYVRLDGRDLLFDPTYSYAGSVPFSETDITWFRDACLSLSYKEHRQIYHGLVNDWYSLSEDYTPADGSLLGSLTYGDGHSLLAKDQSDFSALLLSLDEAINTSSSRYFVTVLQVSTAAASRQELLNQVLYFAGSDGRRYFYAVSERSFGEEKYYCFLLAVQK
jgi:hypothetical protein